MIWKRLRNLWKLSEYQPKDTFIEVQNKVFQKGVPMAQIIKKKDEAINRIVNGN